MHYHIRSEGALLQVLSDSLFKLTLHLLLIVKMHFVQQHTKGIGVHRKSRHFSSHCRKEDDTNLRLFLRNHICTLRKDCTENISF